MKTAIELLNDPSVTLTDGQLETLELVAKRAREEMREFAATDLAEAALRSTHPDVAATVAACATRIRALPVEAAK